MTILLAVDASQPSQNAIAEVLAHPWPFGSKVDVITVIEPAHLWENSETADVISRRSAELLRTTLERLRSAGLDADGDILQGDPKTVILDRALEQQTSCIVVGSHGVSGVERFLLGNVAANVLRHATCSVLIARPRPVPTPINVEGPRVLLATDGSAFSDAAVRSFASRPWPKNVEVCVFSAVELILPTAQALFEPPFIHSKQIETLRETAMKHAQDAVASAVTILRPHFTNVSESISVLLESPQAVILKEAQGWNADLIILGSHGRRGMDRFLLGSVSEHVATHAHCSVEVVR
jgi:nucleotide-binding universal stress UspA family protein